MPNDFLDNWNDFCDYSTECEIHITVNDYERISADSLEGWEDFKYTHIVLSKGNSPSQKMITKRVNDSLGSAYKICQNASKALARMGYSVVRKKIEVPPWSRLAPITKEDVNFNHGGCYFESHIKMIIGDNEQAIENFTKIAEYCGAQLSRNAFKETKNGVCERFITQRSYNCDMAENQRNLSRLLYYLVNWNQDILEIEKEYVVYDSNLGLDYGWLN